MLETIARAITKDNKLVKEMDILLDNEEIWNADYYCLELKDKNKLNLWCCNGADFFETYSCDIKIEFSYWEKQALYPKAKRLQDKILKAKDDIYRQNIIEKLKNIG